MDLFEVILGIIALVFLGGVLRAYLRFAKTRQEYYQALKDKLSNDTRPAGGNSTPAP